jgi:hypothetical protein
MKCQVGEMKVVYLPFGLTWAVLQIIEYGVNLSMHLRGLFHIRLQSVQ